MLPPQDHIPLIDPTGFGGLIQVPTGKTLDTKGRTEYFQGILKKEVSLCCLHQKGRCHAAEKCHQIHVDLAFMRSVRAQNANVVSCCRGHQDTASISPSNVVFWALHLGEAKEIKIMSADGNMILRTVPADKIAITTALVQHVTDGGKATEIPVRNLCRLHLRGGCKYSKDCKRIHLCSQLGEGILDETPSATSVRVSKQSPSPAPEPVVETSTSRRSSVSGTPRPQMQVAPSVSVTPKYTPPQQRASSLFSRVEETPVAVLTERSSSVASVGGLSDSNRTTPRPVSEAATTPRPLGGFSQPSILDTTPLPPAVTNERTLRQADILQDLSFMETSVKLQGLCFDPMLLAQRDDDIWSNNHPSCRTSGGSEWFDASIDCGASSTTSTAANMRSSNWASPNSVHSLWA